MNNKFLPTVVFLAAAGAVIVVIALMTNSGSQEPSPAYNPPAETKSDNQVPPITPAPKKSATPKTYTMTEVAQHANTESCWSVVRGGVYNLTSWISQHPGGEKAILDMCGQDATDDFNGKHGGQPRPESELVGFKIGVLAK